MYAMALAFLVSCSIALVDESIAAKNTASTLDMKNS
jgi:hypothetical protein